MNVSGWWRRRNVRLTLTVWHSAATIFVLGLYAAVVLVVVGQSAVRTLDDRLRGDVQWTAEMVEQRPDGSLAWFDGDSGDGESPWLQVWTLGGDLLYRSSVAERMPIPGSWDWASQHLVGTRSVTTTSQVRLRLLSAESKLAGSPITIQVARPEGPMRRDIARIAAILLLGLPLGVAGAGLGGYWLARRALAPVDRMAERARAITADRLSERLPIDNANDELGRLATVFNDTLGRLEWSFEQMRRFTADVSHELRTPLTAIRSVGEVGLRGRRDERTYRGIIGSMLEEVDRLGSLVDRLLAFSRAETGQSALSPEPVDLGDLVSDVVGLLAVVAEEKQQTLVVECIEAPVVVADRATLRQALINIVDNGVKYTPVGGRIRVRAAEVDGSAVLEISDTGPGIPPEAQGRIFNRYQRGAMASAGPGGTGLGLAIAKRAVEANGGKLSLESGGGGGCTFRILLPHAAVRTSEPSRVGPAGRPRTTLASEQPRASRRA